MEPLKNIFKNIRHLPAESHENAEHTSLVSTAL